MSANHITDRLPDYLMNALDRMTRLEVDEHLNACTMCREEYDALLKLWAKLGTIPEEKPGEQVRVRFYAMLDAYEEGLKQARAQTEPGRALETVLAAFWPKRPAVQFALTLALLLLGFAGGTQVVGKREVQQEEVSLLRDEVRTMGRMLTISLLQQQSASERLRGVSWSSQLEQPDQQVVSALLRALRYDTNINVRLAAIDALEKFIGDPVVRNEVVSALPAQSSPLVQLALVDLMFGERIAQSAEVLRKMSHDPKVDPSVKKRIQEGIKELSL